MQRDLPPRMVETGFGVLLAQGGLALMYQARLVPATIAVLVHHRWRDAPATTGKKSP